MLLGREREQAELGRLVARAATGHGGACVLRGEAGVGKSALLAWTRVAAAPRFATLAASGVPVESGLPFAGLVALLTPVRESLSDMPASQAAPMSSVLGPAPPAEANPYATYVSALALVERAAAGSPLLCLVDDAHWLDGESLDALLFVARRVNDLRVGLVITVREGEGRRIEDHGLPELCLQGLDTPQALSLLARVDPAVAPGVADTLVRVTGGNPLALREIPKTLSAAQRFGEEPLEDPLHPGPTLRRAFARRLDGLAAPVRRALLVAAASDGADLTTILRALSALGLDARALEPAEVAGLVRLEGDRLHFDHPLVRSGAYHAAPPAQRRGAHAALAAALDDAPSAGRRAFHLAAATVGPDESVAHALQDVAVDAMQRGALAHAEFAFTQAARLSASVHSRSPRLLQAGSCAMLTGQLDRAGEHLRRVCAETGDPVLRSDAVHLRGVTQMLTGDPMGGHALLVQEADRLEPEDPRRAAALLLDAAVAYMETGDMESLASTATRTRRMFQQAGDPREALAAVQLAQARIALGDPSGPPLLDAHESFLLEFDPLSGAHELVTMAAVCWTWLEDYGRAERLLRRTITTARGATALRALPLPLAAAAQLAVRRGRWSAAERLAAEADQLAGETRSHFLRPFTLYCQGMVDALRGREVDARARLLRSREMSDAHGFVATNHHVEAALGQLELALGRLPEAIAALSAAHAIYAPAGGGEPGVFQSAPDLVEACVRTHEIARAERTLDQYDVLVRRTGRSWGRAAVARCHGLLDDDRAVDMHFALALREHRPGVLPFERARTQLLYGERLRRTGRRVDARQQLDEALTTFERLGAPVWARRARQELAASGARMERRDHAALARLTQQERRVAQLVVDGATNREAAAALFLSPKTVEAHLRQVFRKVGVRSRAELVAVGVRGGLEVSSKE